MEPARCPNYDQCALVSRGLDMDEGAYKAYIDSFCCCKKEAWSSCMRFRAKKEIHFCPDFVLPDSHYTIEEIIDRFDNKHNL